MLALHFDGSTARVKDIAEPAPFSDSALVRVSLAGVCDTDLQLVKGYMGFRGVLGHEFVGTVAEGPSELRGQRVVGEINFACESCPVCDAGMQRHCPSRRVLGIQDADGVFAEYVRIPIANLHTVPGLRARRGRGLRRAPRRGLRDPRAGRRRSRARAASCSATASSACSSRRCSQGAGARVLAVGKHRGEAGDPGAPRDRDRRAAGLEAGARLPRRGGHRQPRRLRMRRRGREAARNAGPEEYRSRDPDASTWRPWSWTRSGSSDRAAAPFRPPLRALETGSVDVRSLICDRVPLRDAAEALRLADAPGALKVLIETA